LIARRAKELGVKNPLSNKNLAAENNAVPTGSGNPVRGAVNPDARVSAPYTEGRQAPSSGDHNVGQGRNADLAHGHAGETRPRDYSNPILNMLKDHVSASSSYSPSRGVMGYEYEQAADVSRLDANDTGWSRGSYAGMGNVPDTYQRPSDSIARNSPTARDASALLSNGVQSNAVSLKAQSRQEQLAIMKEHMWTGRV
jgi:hypothetical protein